MLNLQLPSCQQLYGCYISRQHSHNPPAPCQQTPNLSLDRLGLWRFTLIGIKHPGQSHAHDMFLISPRSALLSPVIHTRRARTGESSPRSSLLPAYSGLVGWANVALLYGPPAQSLPWNWGPLLGARVRLYLTTRINIPG